MKKTLVIVLATVISLILSVPTFAMGDCQVTICNVAVREGPGADYEVIDGIDAGTEVLVVDGINDCEGVTWAKLQCGGYVRYDLLREYEAEDADCSVDYDEESLPIYEDEDENDCSCDEDEDLQVYEEYLPTEDCEVQFYKTVQVDANVRKGPSMNCEIVNGVSAGTSVGIICEDNRWYLTNYGGYIGANLFEKDCEEENLPVYEEEEELPVYEEENECELPVYEEENECELPVYEEENECELPVYEEESSECETECNRSDCIVISIAKQTVVMYDENGNPVCQGPCVTGNFLDKDTPCGEFSIQDKETNRYLKGKGYNAFVTYWMPFHDGCGLHDASWRDSFGGDIYQGDGSHGCVNMSNELAATIYENCYVGMPVIVE